MRKPKFKLTNYKPQPRPVTKQQHYTKPILTAIKLDPSQAILTTCRVYQNGGAWMAGGFCSVKSSAA